MCFNPLNSISTYITFGSDFYSNLIRIGIICLLLTYLYKHRWGEFFDVNPDTATEQNTTNSSQMFKKINTN